MPAIDPAALRKAMDLSGITPAQLADEVGLSVDYVLNIRGGSRRLKRNPAMRKNIARALNVPVHWIEHHDETDDAA